MYQAITVYKSELEEPNALIVSCNTFFFVIVDHWNVFKCLAMRKADGNISTLLKRLVTCFTKITHIIITNKHIKL